MIALISALLGIVGGIVPDIVKMFRAKQEHAQEMERLRLQGENTVALAKAQSDGRLAEIRENQVTEEIRGFAEQMKAIYASQKPTGVKWVDAWNAIMRPLAVTNTILIFSLGASCIIWGVAAQLFDGQIDPLQAAGIILGGVLGEYIQGVWGFLFGYRSSRAVMSGR